MAHFTISSGSTDTDRHTLTDTRQTQTLRGISSKTLAICLKELQKGGVLERQAYNEIPPRVEYKLTIKGQELVESLIDLLHWMRRWSSNSKAA
ncbi:MAG: winged helix-turn-helix transcriptional regulator [Candidatus Nitrosopolaris sp.]|jgi:DNA-binding HxlR family transcriptional regulator